VTFTGQGVSPGVACGPVSLGHSGLDEVAARALRDDEVEHELDRLESAGRAARVSLIRQRDSLANRFTEEEQRIFDTHVKLLSDPVLEADVRERIVKKRMNLEGAVKETLGVYERLFDVVQSEALRNKLSDLRDVALRLLRCSRHTSAPVSSAAAEGEGGILVVHELSLSDLTEALDHGIAGIVAEAGNPASHAAILTRAAGLPAVIGAGELGPRISRGDLLLMDGESGRVILNPPSELIRAATAGKAEREAVPLAPADLVGGQRIHLLAAVASPGEARSAAALGIREVGLYRTELPVIQRKGSPREASLTALYRQVFHAAERIHFRLPDIDSLTELGGPPLPPDPNPAMGLRGCRLLGERPDMLLTQVRAILKAGEGREIHIAAPFVNDLGELNRVREAVENARNELRLAGVKVSGPVRVGVVVETPAAALLGRDLTLKADFLLVGLDNLAQFLLSADRRSEHPAVLRVLERPHPAVLRAVRKLVELADGLETEITFYGETLTEGPMLPLLVGLGAERFAVRPGLLSEVHALLGVLDLDVCERVADAACRAVTPRELQAVLPSAWNC